MADVVYEAMFILDSNRYSRDPAGVSGQIPQMIQQHGGEVLANRLWEERRLAYPIGSHRKGTYWLTYFKLESKNLAQVQRQVQLNENVVRSLFLKVEPRIVDVLVAHAQTGTGPVSDPRPASAKAEETAARSSRGPAAEVIMPEEELNALE